MMAPAVYLLASQRNGTLYKGMTSDLIQRVWQHKHENGSKFTTQYGVKKLVWYLHCGNWENAATWEKRLRRYSRKWKLNLIEEMNPNWDDLWDEINGVREITNKNDEPSLHAEQSECL